MQLKSLATDLIWYKAITSLQADSKLSFLGYIWWVVDPILYMGVFYIVFGLVLNRGGEDFIPFLLTGLVFWKWFDSSIKAGAASILEGKGLSRQIYINKLLFPLSASLAMLLRNLVIIAVYLVFLLICGYQPDMEWLTLIPLVIAQGVLITGGSIFLASIVPFFPDLKLLINYLMTLMFFMSGIFYNITELNSEMAKYLLINPMAGLISCYRDVLLYGNWSSSTPILYAFGFGLVLSIIGAMIIRKFDYEYPRVFFG